MCLWPTCRWGSARRHVVGGRDLVDRCGVLGRSALVDLAALTLGDAPECATLLGCGIEAQAVDLAAFVVLWQVLGNRKTFRITEEQSVTVLPSLHLLARAAPGAALRFGSLVRVEITGAERPADFLDVLGKANH